MVRRILHINCHPAFNNKEHATNQLAAYGLHLLGKTPDVEIDVINLYDEKTNIPPINERMLSMWDKAETERSASEQALFEVQNKLIEQWVAADYILIYSPLYNFNITSKLKDYLDNILITGRTFDYTESGSVVGLLDDDKKVAYIQCSGWSYEKELRLINSDIAPQYMRTILSFMGIHDMQLIRAQGLDWEPMENQDKIEAAKEEIGGFIIEHIGDR